VILGDAHSGNVKGPDHKSLGKLAIGTERSMESIIITTPELQPLPIPSWKQWKEFEC
jgi:hypothetical protein